MPNSLYDYNVHSNLKLTEDRTLDSPGMYDFQLSQALVTCPDESITRAIITAPQGTYEHDADFNWGITYPDTFLDILHDEIKKDRTKVNKSLRAVFNSRRPNTELNEPYFPTPAEMTRFEYCKRMLEAYGLVIPPVKFVRVESSTLHAFTTLLDKQIHITNHGLSCGASELAQTLYEEHNHAVLGHDDFTRSYQDFLQRTIINFIAEKTNTVI